MKAWRWVAARGEPVVIVENKRADPRYRYIPELRGQDYTSLASVPMVSGRGQVIGVLNVHTRERRHFRQADIGLLRSTANLMPVRSRTRVCIRSLRCGSWPTSVSPSG